MSSSLPKRTSGKQKNESETVQIDSVQIDSVQIDSVQWRSIARCGCQAYADTVTTIGRGARCR